MKNSKLGTFSESVVRTVTFLPTAMSCFFGCFRVRDDPSLHPRTSLFFDSSTFTREAAGSRNGLSSLFNFEDNEDYSIKDTDTMASESPSYTHELKDEATFLKACGTVPKTPDEILKLSQRLVGSPHDADSEPLKFLSWFPDTSIDKLQLGYQTGQPQIVVRQCEAGENGLCSLADTPISSSPTKNSGIVCDNTALTPWNPTMKIRGRSKSVRFECDMNASYSGSPSKNLSRNSDKPDSPGNEASKPSTCPTPLKLSNEMQTPGTVFPANLDYIPNMNTRIRSHYTHSVLNPVESVSRWQTLNEKDSKYDRLSGEIRESTELPENVTPKPKMNVMETSYPKEMKEEASLSAWLKPVSSRHDNNQEFRAYDSRGHCVRRIPADRPIIGMVAAHWNQSEFSHISQKLWDGNGIPNSTSKYKENQKVNWHATPFEQRLEKALSEESLISQRKHFQGKPIAFDKEEKTDSVISHLQSSTHSQSVVSFGQITSVIFNSC